MANFSCETNRTVSDAEKDKIIEELKDVVNTIFKGFEEANIGMVTESWYNSPDFVFILNGRTSTYEEVLKGMGGFFNSILNQELTIIDEKYAFLDKSTVIYTTNCKFLENFKDANATLSDPMVMQFTFMKIDDTWKVINALETSVRQDVRNIDSSNS